MRHLLLALPLLLLQVPTAQAQISVSIGINLPVYPQLQRVPGYPVYYAPQAPGNFFFYDGLYWVFEDDDWYYSSWYNGPWRLMEPVYVPVYLLRVPVRYYRRPPVYFTYWRADAPPRWNERWGRDWERQRSGWDRWDRNKAPAPAPLPDYQRNYPQGRYPQAEQQDNIRSEKYRYQPREPVVRQQLAQPQRVAPSPREREDVRRPERMERPERPERPERVERMERPERMERAQPQYQPRSEERMAPAPDRRAYEQRRSEQRAAPEPRVEMQRQPQMQPRERVEQPRMEPSNRGGGGQDRQPRQRRLEDEEPGRGNERGNRG
ncbi:hypothetical protein [Hydrogenophaga sp. PBL-H3]|uniref:hypothetical protein n=1 Tax=Hydrogenophaga sp. PBL-H3 TaxID=434010 RepID=UPI0013202F75|nr:hypothetical protein [Hydrogenophaga sp. PBL-H3]QHE74657.1 hypothetical protein F9Z45_00660 [Hydrogenophaga sp. PBL-H3]QHE79082.1 hypothetical protein F9Z44_00660 [Hydrogenophaga sp. PBL-H3]